MKLDNLRQWRDDDMNNNNHNRTKMAAAAMVSSLLLLGCFNISYAVPPQQPGKAMLGDVKTTDLVVTNEVDPVFSTWTNGNNYVSKVFTNGTEVAVNHNQIRLDLPFDGKLDATNGVAYGTLKVQPEDAPVGPGHAILDYEGLRFTTTTTAPDITYSLNGIFALYPGGNEQWYEFSNSANGIARLKDIPTITTNNVPVEVKDGRVEIPLDEYVKLADLQEGITFDKLSATNLTVNGKNVSVEGHKHSTSEITNLQEVVENEIIAAGQTNGIHLGTNLTYDASRVPFIVIGTDSEASTNYTTAIGHGAVAKGNLSTAIGASDAIGNLSLAMGVNSVASNQQTIAIGVASVANGNFSTSIGNFSYASGEASLALGYDNEATDLDSVAVGYRNHATGPYSVAMGRSNDAGYGCVVIGRGNWARADGMIIGNNAKSFDRDDTSIGFGTVTSNSYSLAIGYYAHAYGPWEKEDPTIPGFVQWRNYNQPVSIGSYTLASQEGAVALGRHAIATNENSVVVGSIGQHLTSNYKNGGYSIIPTYNASHGDGTLTLGVPSPEKMFVGDTNLVDTIKNVASDIEDLKGYLTTNDVDNTLSQTGKAADAKETGDALAGKLSIGGGTMAGVLHIPYNLLSVEGGASAAAQWNIVWQSAMDNWVFRIKPENSATPYFIRIPNTAGTLALLSDIPTITTNGTPVEVNGGKVEIPLDEYVKRADLITKLGYADVASLRANGNLVPGCQYQITNYVATTTQSGTQSANHPFDIIVTATSTNALSEEVRATLHAGDTYFPGGNCNLAAWKVWYSIDNDTKKFAWADPTNGKGVIYRMIDEYGNDVPYDFKGIRFQKQIPFYNNNGVATQTNSFWCYTFDGGWSQSGARRQMDFSIDDTGYSNFIFGNKIRPYIVEVTSGGYYLQQKLNNIVFLGYNVEENFFDEGCHDIILGQKNSSSANVIKNDFGKGCFANEFGAFFIGNEVKSYANLCRYVFTGTPSATALRTQSNTIGEACSGIVLSRHNSLNTIENGCVDITLAENVSNVNIANGSERITIGHDSSGINIGANVEDVNLGYACYGVEVGTHSQLVNIGANTNGLWRHITIAPGVQYLNLTKADTQNFGQNISVQSGTYGTASNHGTITVEVNTPHHVEYKPQGSTSIEVPVSTNLSSRVTSRSATSYSEIQSVHTSWR